MEKTYITEIRQYFEYGRDEFFDVVDDVLTGIENLGDDDCIMQGISDNLIYSDDEWEVLRHYCSAQEADWNEAYYSFVDDIYGVASYIHSKERIDSEDDDEDLYE